MRVLKEFTKGEIKISVFYMNQKFILKFEKDNLEQICKLSQFDYLISDENQLSSLISDEFIEKISSEFERMNQIFSQQFESIKI